MAESPRTENKHPVRLILRHHWLLTLKPSSYPSVLLCLVPAHRLQAIINSSQNSNQVILIKSQHSNKDWYLFFSHRAFRKTMCHLYSNLEEITCSSTLLHRFFSDIFILEQSSMGREFCALTMFLPRETEFSFSFKNLDTHI